MAALYIDPRGPYPKMPGVDCWDAERDAENYGGPWPVVAHPPCGPWGRLRHLYRGDEHALGLVAFAQVRRWGGVLEHPAGSRLWDAAGVGTRADPGWWQEVHQCNWGHKVRKPTWLYFVGVDPRAVRVPPPREPTHAIFFGRWERSGHAGPKLPGASKEIRRRTPPAFAEWLVALARSVPENAHALRPGAPYPDGSESQ